MLISSKVDKTLLQEVVNRLLYCNEEYAKELALLNEKHPSPREVKLGPGIYRKEAA